MDSSLRKRRRGIGCLLECQNTDYGISSPANILKRNAIDSAIKPKYFDIIVAQVSISHILNIYKYSIARPVIIPVHKEIDRELSKPSEI